MPQVLFKSVPVYNKLAADVINTIPAPKQFANIKKSNLLQSLLQYDTNIYINVTNIEFTKRAEFFLQENTPCCQSLLTLSFLEPFDNYESMSTIHIHGTSIKAKLADNNMLKRLNNMYEYEDLLRDSYFDVAVDAPNNVRYTYELFDPTEIVKHDTLDFGTPNTYPYRYELKPCGHIFTNAVYQR